MGLKLASESLPALSGMLSGKKYNMLGRIVTHWDKIVGADMAAKTLPGKLKYKYAKGKKTPEFTLEIETSSRRHSYELSCGSDTGTDKPDFW